MKMKSKLFGFGAKSALYLMAICGALFTSCYEKEEIDVDPVAPAAYYVIGSVSNGSNDQPLNATVTVDGAAVTLTNGAFIKKVEYKEAGYVVTATADGFYPVTKTVYAIKVLDGQTYSVYAELRLFDISSQITNPTLAVSPTVAQITPAIQQNITANFKVEVESPDVQLGATTIALEDGEVILTTPVALSVPSYDPVTISYSYYEGFNLANEITTKSTPTYQEQYIANAANFLHRTYGLTKRISNALLTGGGYSIIGFRLIHTIKLQELIFRINSMDYSSIVSWYSNTRVEPMVDSHDSHDSHDAHGGSSNAGGGAGTAE